MCKILIVEDNKVTRKGMISIAQSINPSIEFEQTGCAKEALNIAMNNDILAFFIDIQLEDYSGLILAKQLREK